MLHGKKIVEMLPAYKAEQTLKQRLADILFDVVDEVLLVDDDGTDARVAPAREAASV
jgi:hypothetical protein